jgi:hypothetical protein
MLGRGSHTPAQALSRCLIKAFMHTLIQNLRGFVCVLRAGYYNPAIQYNQTTPCTECPLGTTSSVEGSDDVNDCTCKLRIVVSWHVEH